MVMQSSSFFPQPKSNLSDFDKILEDLKTKCNHLLQYSNQFSIKSDDQKIIKNVINSINEVQNYRELAQENEKTRDNQGFLPYCYLLQTYEDEIDKHLNIIKNELHIFLQKQSVSKDLKNNYFLTILEQVKTLLDQLLSLNYSKKRNTNKKEILKDIENYKDSLSSKKFLSRIT